MSEIIELTDENFETHLKSADKPILVDYWAAMEVARVRVRG